MAQEVELSADLLGLIFENQAEIYANEIRSIFAESVISINREVEIMRESGLSEDEIFGILETDLNTLNEETGRTGGRIFGKLTSGIANQSRSRLQRLERQIADHELERITQKPIFGDDGRVVAVEQEVRGAQLWRWICALTNTCPDCLPRHSEVDTMESWISRGLPKSGFSVCGGNCECELVEPGDEPNSFAREPIQLASRKIRISQAEIEDINNRGGPTTEKERAIFNIFGKAKDAKGVSTLIEAFNEKF